MTLFRKDSKEMFPFKVLEGGNINLRPAEDGSSGLKMDHIYFQNWAWARLTKPVYFTGLYNVLFKESRMWNISCPICTMLSHILFRCNVSIHNIFFCVYKFYLPPKK